MDIHDALTVRLESTLRLPCVLDRESTLQEWLADPRGNAILGPFYSEIETQSRKAFGGGDDNKSVIGMDSMDMLNDMPLISVLMFQQDALPMPAEEIVDALLAQVHSMDENIPA